MYHNPILTTDRIIKTIIGLNAGMFILSLFLYPSSGLSMNPFNFLSPDGKSIFLLGATGTIPIDKYHRIWSLVSAGYLHGSLLHILFNMFALNQIIPLVIEAYGISRMVILYTICGIMGFLVSYFAGVRFTVGASAAICGLIGAALYYGKSRGGAYGQAIYKQMSGWIIGLIIFGLTPGINNWGHGGGILSGIFFGFLIEYQEKSTENLFHKFLAVICVIVTIAILVWSVISAVSYRFI